MNNLIATHKEVKKYLEQNSYKNIRVINPAEEKELIAIIKNLPNKPIHIYDITANKEQKEKNIFEVSDHINKTGHNPLIGNQNKIDTPFVDISSLYDNKNGIKTNCLGKYFNQHKSLYTYASTYLCYVSIVARALKRKNIKGFLINIK